MKEKEFLEFIVKNLVDHKNDVIINVIEGERLTLLELKVHKDDVGKVIGKYGNIAKAIRTLLNVTGTKQGKKVVLEILD
jgi:hypothetical protein